LDSVNTSLNFSFLPSSRGPTTMTVFSLSSSWQRACRRRACFSHARAWPF
jgi:hypothetical protein